MELNMINGFNSVGFVALNESEMLEVSGGEGLVHVIEGAVMAGGGITAFNVLSGMTTTKVIPALLMTGGAVGASIAIVCGVAVVGYGIYEICN